MREKKGVFSFVFFCRVAWVRERKVKESSKIWSLCTKTYKKYVLMPCRVKKRGKETPFSFPRIFRSSKNCSRFSTTVSLENRWKVKRHATTTMMTVLDGKSVCDVLESATHNMQCHISNNSIITRFITRMLSIDVFVDTREWEDIRCTNVLMCPIAYVHINITLWCKSTDASIKITFFLLMYPHIFVYI